MPRFRANELTMDQVTANLKVLADFRNNEFITSNLTIREGIFIKTSGKFNLFKKVVRDAEDSLENSKVLDEIKKNLDRYVLHLATNKTDECLDILLNGIYGFLKLGSNYRGRENVANIADAMSEVCKLGRKWIEKRLEWFNSFKKATYSQGNFNRANNVHRGGTCWAMALDWARRFVLKSKMGYANGQPFNESKLLHRGKYIAHVFNLRQINKYANLGEAIGKLSARQFSRTTRLVNQYRLEQPGVFLKGYERTIEEKFNNLAYEIDGNLGIKNIYLGNQSNKNTGVNSRVETINSLVNKINHWVSLDTQNGDNNRFVHGIGFYMEEDIGFTEWSINRKPQPLFTITPLPKSKISGHEVAFAYNHPTKKYYFMDPNIGEWETSDKNKVAELIYWVLKVYTVSRDDKNRYYCKEINKTETQLISTTP